MFPFCLHATSALYDPITVLFCINIHFRIFDIFLKFLCVRRFVLKRRADYVKTLCPHYFDMEYTWSVCRNLAGDFFSTVCFE